jgi:hypothetical protein
VHCDESFRVDPKLVVHLHSKNLHHYKQLAKLWGEESINNVSCNASIGYSLFHRNGEPCQQERQYKR